MQVKAALNKHMLRNPVLWTFHPFGSWLDEVTDWSAIVYHSVDDYAANPGACSQCVLEAERLMLDRSDLVLCASGTRFENEPPAIRAKVRRVPNNAVDLDVFIDGELLPAEPSDVAAILSGGAPVIGFVGNLAAYKVDLSLVETVANHNQDMLFVFVGPIGAGDPLTGRRLDRLRALSNVRLVGTRPYAELPFWIRRFDVCWIPFNVTNSTANIPMKFFEYLSCGKPVVATDLPSLREYRGRYWPATDLETTSRAFRFAAAEALKPEAVRRWRQLGTSNSWSSRIEELTSQINWAVARNAERSAEKD